MIICKNIFTVYRRFFVSVKGVVFHVPGLNKVSDIFLFCKWNIKILKTALAPGSWNNQFNHIKNIFTEYSCFKDSQEGSDSYSTSPTHLSNSETDCHDDFHNFVLHANHHQVAFL